MKLGARGAPIVQRLTSSRCHGAGMAGRCGPVVPMCAKKGCLARTAARMKAVVRLANWPWLYALQSELLIASRRVVTSPTSLTTYSAPQ